MPRWRCTLTVEPNHVILKDCCTTAPLRSEGVLIADAVGKANVLNKQYCSVFTKEEIPVTISKGPSQAPTMPNIQVTAEGVQHLLKELKPHKASGPDQISTRVLKELAEPLSQPLAKFFQNSIDQRHSSHTMEKSSHHTHI